MELIRAGDDGQDVFTREAIASMVERANVDRLYVTLDFSQKVEDIVGYVHAVEMEGDAAVVEFSFFDTPRANAAANTLAGLALALKGVRHTDGTIDLTTPSLIDAKSKIEPPAPTKVLCSKHYPDAPELRCRLAKDHDGGCYYSRLPGPHRSGVGSDG
jgi:hypothetical protein